MIRARLAVTSLLVLLALAGCAVGPDYHRPRVDLPAGYGAAAAQQSAELRQWWSNFNDPALERLIDEATQANLDLKLASARVREARAARGVVAADLFPTIDADASYTRRQRSLNVNGVSSGTSGTGNNGNFGPRNTDLYQAGFDSTWEIDVFGGVRRSIEAANADIQASIEARRDVLITLLGDVARNYIELRGRQRQLAITRANLKSQQDTLDLTRARFNAGIVGELDVARARALAETTASQVPTFQSQIQQSIHRLGVLLGREPAALAKDLEIDAPIPTGVSSLPAGLPSDLLRRRADIRRAERALAAQTARIGEATADLFPRFSLTGSFGLQSAHYRDITDSDSVFWNIGPALRWNIFNAGKFYSNIGVQNARQQQTLVQYRQTILTALEEVENALVLFQHEQDRRVSLAAAVESNRRAVQLANDLYSRGLTDYLSVQESQRNLLQAEDQLAQSETLVSSNLVALYKALGGGWETFENDTK